jgi:hypothetical protein
MPRHDRHTPEISKTRRAFHAKQKSLLQKRIDKMKRATGASAKRQKEALHIEYVMEDQ